MIQIATIVPSIVMALTELGTFLLKRNITPKIRIRIVKRGKLVGRLSIVLIQTP
jgi:hypothetical protein